MIASEQEWIDEHALELSQRVPDVQPHSAFERRQIDEAGRAVDKLHVVGRRIFKRTARLEQRDLQIQRVDARVGDHRERPLVRIGDVCDPIVLEERSMRAMRVLELGDQLAILYQSRVHDCPASHEAREHAAAGEVLERVSALGVDRSKHPALVEEHVTRRVTKRPWNTSCDFPFRYGLHYCCGGLGCDTDAASDCGGRTAWT